MCAGRSSPLRSPGRGHGGLCGVWGDVTAARLGDYAPENSLRVRSLQEVAATFAAIVHEVGGLSTSAERAERFARRLVEAGAEYETG